MTLSRLVMWYLCFSPSIPSGNMKLYLLFLSLSRRLHPCQYLSVDDSIHVNVNNPLQLPPHNLTPFPDDALRDAQIPSPLLIATRMAICRHALPHTLFYPVHSQRVCLVCCRCLPCAEQLGYVAPQLGLESAGLQELCQCGFYAPDSARREEGGVDAVSERGGQGGGLGGG
jgi:hypothetical protein